MSCFDYKRHFISRTNSFKRTLSLFMNEMAYPHTNPDSQHKLNNTRKSSEARETEFSS
jgi:hypothetical protein